MARLILQTGDGAGDIGNSVSVDVIGTNAAETINVSANGKGTFDGSFSRGNDTIVIAGNAANYQIRQTGTNQVAITNATGANLIIPVGTGVTIKFADVTDGRTLTFNSSNAIVLGSQTVTSTASTISTGTTTPPTSGNEFFLGVAQDVIVGTSADDLFVADLIQNPLGEQTNSLGTGDRLTGNGGIDTLEAHVQDASPLNGGPGSAIAPITSGVEEIYVTADQAYDGYDEDETSIALGVEVNARRMTGVTDLGSFLSDTSLTFYNVNTLSTGAVLGDESSARRTGVMTVRMERTGASTPLNDAANLTVLFDNDYLRPDDSVTSGAQLHVQMMDLDAAIRDATSRPLLNNPYTSFIFRVGSQTVSVAINENSETYAALLADFQAALAANPITAGKVTASFGPLFTANDTDNDPGGSAQGTEILLTNTGPEPLTAVQFIAANGVPSDLDFHLQTYNQAPSTTDRLIEVNIELDKVGNGGDLGNVAADPHLANSSQVFAGGGYLTVGGMQTDDEHYEESILNNTWKNGAIANPGVEQFNIKLEGSAIEDSSLAGIQSTHNALRVINLTNPGSTADLIVGNSNTRYASVVNGALDVDGEFGEDPNDADLTDVRNNAVKDVLLFNAGSFTANSAVYGMFSDEVVAKYLNLIDNQVNPREDNGQAIWTFGSGNNLVNLNISKVNAAFEGAVAREDFELDVITNGGADRVQLQFGNGNDDFTFFSDSVANWYTNAAINAFRYVGGTSVGNNRYVDMQIRVDTGADNDVVELWGASVVNVSAGAGDDAIYTDNSGVRNQFRNNALTAGYAGDSDKATWVFNSMDDTTWDVEHLQSQTRLSISADSVATVGSGTTGSINNLALRVSFQDIENSLTVYVANSDSTAGAATITDLQINQAIKNAINNDPVLSKLLIAEDGPSGVLIVRSLVDGLHANTDLQVSLYSTTTTVNAGQTGHLITAAELARLGFNADGSATGNTTSDRWYSDFGLLGGQLTGGDSTNVNNNVIDGGADNDVIVLSTNYNSTETLDINGVFSSATGQDTVLNFDTTPDRALTGGSAEVQVIDLAAAAGNATNPVATTGAGTVSFSIYDVNGNLIPITPIAFGAGTLLTDLAVQIQNAINGNAAAAAAVTALAIDGPDADATADDIRITYDVNGNAPTQSTVTINGTTSGAAEVANIVLTVNGDGSVDAGTAQLSFGGVTYAPVSVGANSTIDDIGAILASTVNTNATATYNATTDTITITASAAGAAADAALSYTPTDGNGDLVGTTTTTTQGTDPSPTGVTASGSTVTQGSNPTVLLTGGYDIIDLTTVMGAPVAANFRNDAPGNGAEEDGVAFNEAGQVSFATLNSGAIVITDTFSASDFGANAPTTELARIQAIATAADAAATPVGSNGTAPTLRSVVITVDSDNVGHFYLITNGAAAKDATVAHLGNIEMATYDNKPTIGDWDLMTVANFTPLTAETIVTTFPVA